MTENIKVTLYNKLTFLGKESAAVISFPCQKGDLSILELIINTYSAGSLK